MTAPSSARPDRPRGWTVLIGALVALTVATGIVAVPWFLLQDRAAPAPPAGPRWFGGYVDVTAGVGTAGTTDPSGDAEVLAFVVAAAPQTCAPTWGGAYSLAQAGHALDLDHLVERARQGGGPVAISFGGPRGAELAGACVSVGALADAYGAVLDRYAVTTMDLDLSGPALGDATAGERRAHAVAQLQAGHRARGIDLAVWITLPAGRDGLDTDGLRSIRQMQQAGVQLTGVNAMTGDDGASPGGPSPGDAAVSALTAVHDQLGRLYDELNIALPADGAWAIMGATPTIGRTDGHDEVFGLDDAATVNAFAQRQRLARLSMWSVNRDHACTAEDSADPASGGCSGIPQQDGAFASVLRRGWGAGEAGRGAPPRLASAPTPSPSTSAAEPDP
jgi:chitinase